MKKRIQQYGLMAIIIGGVCGVTAECIRCMKMPVTQRLPAAQRFPAAADTGSLPWAEEVIMLGNVIIGDKRVVRAELYPSMERTRPSYPKKLVPSCGCLHPIFEDGANTNANKVVVDFDYKAEGPEGKDEKSILLLSDTGKLVGRIIVRATNLPAVSISPSNINYGMRSARSMMSCVVTLTKNGRSPLPTKLLNKPDWVNAKLAYSSGKTQKWDISISPLTIPGPITASLTWGTGRGEVDSIVVLSGYVSGLIKAEPNELSFPIGMGISPETTSFELQGSQLVSAENAPFCAVASSPYIKVILRRGVADGRILGNAIMLSHNLSSPIIAGEIIIENKKGLKMLRIPYRAITLSGRK